MLLCPVCKTNIDEKLFIKTYVSSFSKKEYKLYHCSFCELEWWEPLESFSNFYEEEGCESYTLFHMGLKKEIEENHKMFFKLIPIKSGKILDVGCGDGIFLEEAKKRGYEVWGIDFDQKSIRVCQEKRGLENTFVMTPQEFLRVAQEKELKFDVITFFEVLEHQDKPREFLECIKKMIKPGGYLAGSVPNRELIKGVKKSLNYSQYNFPVHHFLWFNKKALFSTLNFFNFSEIIIKEVSSGNIFRELIENCYRIECAISGIKGVYLRESLKKKILKDSYLKASLKQKIFFKVLKGIRNLFFLSFSLATYPIIVKPTLYFQSRRQI